MAIMNLNFIFTLFFSLFIAGTAALPAKIGVNYIAAAHPPPKRVAAALQALKITSVRLPDPSPAVVRALTDRHMSLLLSVPNELVAKMASNRSAASTWISTYVVPFYPRRIGKFLISVGTDVFEDSPVDLSDKLLPAIRNLHLSLQDHGINKISVSSTFSYDKILSTSFPPSSATFQEPVLETLIQPLLELLSKYNSSFLINIYPYRLYRQSPGMGISFPLFHQSNDLKYRPDFPYTNLFDVMVDSVVSAMRAVGIEVPLIVTETGWPSSGDRNEPEANPVFAEMYIKGLIHHLNSGLGTPLRKEGVAQTYIYELFDREEVGTNTAVQNWGILKGNLKQKYALSCSVCVGGLGNMLLGLFSIVFTAIILG